MDRKDIVLLVIESASDEGLSPLQLQKSLFIIGQSQLAGLPSDGIYSQIEQAGIDTLKRVKTRC